MKPETISLGEACAVVMGQSPPGTSYNATGDGLPFFQGKTDFGELYPRVRVFCNQPSRIAQAGDILMSVRAPVGPTNLAKEMCCIGRGLAALRTGPRLDMKFLLYFLRHHEPQLASQGQGSTFEAVNRDDLEEIQIPLLVLSEQQRIAARLEEADRLKRTRHYALELTATYITAAFLKLFGDLNPTVNAWLMEPLGERLEAIEGGVNFNPVGEKDPASDWRVLKVSAVSWNDFRAEESKPISPTESFSEKLIVQCGDLIMSRANTLELVGAVARVREPPPKVLLPDKLWRLKIRATSELLPDYLLYALRSRRVRREIEIRASGTSGSMKNISKEDVRELRLPQPPLKLQQTFAALVERVECLRAVQHEALRQAEHLFQTLLHQAFSESP